MSRSVILCCAYQLLRLHTVAVGGDLKARCVETLDADNSSWRSSRTDCSHKSTFNSSSQWRHCFYI